MDCDCFGSRARKMEGRFAIGKTRNMLGRVKGLLSKRALRMADEAVLLTCERIAADGTVNPWVLDVGCGTGARTQIYANRLASDHIVGFDVDVLGIQGANDRSIRTIVGDFEKPLPFRSEVFDVVIMNQVVEHARNLDLLVSEVARILRRMGSFLLATPNLSSWHNILALILQQQAFSQTISSKVYIGNKFSRNYLQEIPYDFPQHCHILTPRGAVDLLRMYGFEIVEITGAGYFPLPARFLCTLDPGHAQYLILWAVRVG